jgi:hypothetical protein
MYSVPLTNLLAQAIARLDADLYTALPHTGAQVKTWTQILAGPGERLRYFQHPVAFPSLLLPWWVMERLAVGMSPDMELQSRLVYSTINGYYYIRMVDNVMDRQVTTERQLLPALNFFHTRFENAYHELFPVGHPFWEFFEATWLQSADVAMADATLDEIDLNTFAGISAKKVCAAKIPVAAVCYANNQPRWIEPWSTFIDALGGWHQFLNDLFDWRKDAANEGRTYFLCEYERRKIEDEPLVRWVSREGFSWGVEVLQTRMANLLQDATRLGCPPLIDYLNQRQAGLNNQIAAVQPGLKIINRLLRI